jgi:phytoene synthase
VQLVPEAAAVRAARAAVRALTKRRGANFSLGFRLLPPAKRRAVYAAYAACRVPDDIVDESEGDAAGAPEGARLDSWAAEIEATYAGHPGTSVTYALAEVLRDFPIPRQALLRLVEGCRMDLQRSRYGSFAELERYCDLVAVTISEISLAIFGLVREEGRALGRHLALALQLTNICRDVREDLGRGRVYLPADEMAEFGVSVHDLEGGRVDTPAYRALMTFQCRRARTHFAAANPLPDCLAGDSRAAVRVMGGVYRRILDRIARDPVAAFHRRVELPPWQRWWAVASGLCGQPFVPL